MCTLPSAEHRPSPHSPASCLTCNCAQLWDSRWRLKSVLRLAPEYDHDLYFDENPDHPLYHPPPGGGMAAIRRMDHDSNMWALNKWVHTQATRLHEYASSIKLGIAGFLWLLELLQLSYFPLRAAFPKTMSLWKSISEGLATLNVSSMSGKDSFLPAFVTCIILAGIAFAIATTQVCGRPKEPPPPSLSHAHSSTLLSSFFFFVHCASAVSRCTVLALGSAFPVSPSHTWPRTCRVRSHAACAARAGCCTTRPSCENG
jgi:hypothetical protein